MKQQITLIFETTPHWIWLRGGFSLCFYFLSPENVKICLFQSVSEAEDVWWSVQMLMLFSCNFPFGFGKNFFV